MKYLEWLAGLWRSINLFRLWGVLVQMHPTVLFFPAGWCLWNGWRMGGWPAVWESLLFLDIIFGSLLAHEFAHIAMARYYGFPANRILMLPFGCAAFLGEAPDEPRQEFWIAAAGPLASALLAVAGGVPFFWLRRAGYWGSPGFEMLGLFAIFNGVTALFNLFPLFPMDGGRILRALLAMGLRRLLGWPPSAALHLASRVMVRWVGRPLVLAVALLTLFHPQAWIHLLLAGFLVLAGEAELMLLTNDGYKALADDTPVAADAEVGPRKVRSPAAA